MWTPACGRHLLIPAEPGLLRSSGGLCEKLLDVLLILTEWLVGVIFFLADKFLLLMPG